MVQAVAVLKRVNGKAGDIRLALSGVCRATRLASAEKILASGPKEDDPVSKLLMYLLEVRHLGAAGRALAGPEVEHHRLPLGEEVRELERFSAHLVHALVDEYLEVERDRDARRGC